MSHHEVSAPFPVAYGTEEEKGIMIDATGGMDEPYDFVGRYSNYLPGSLGTDTDFLTNGFKVYRGGTEQADRPTNLEIATPECATPSELVVYSRANEGLTRTMLDSYVAETSEELGRPVSARYQRRVIDSHGNRKACHDNYAADINRSTKSRLFDHLASRSIVTGAGVVAPGRFELAQKIGGLTRVEGYGYFGSMVRVSHAEGTPRLEVRCSDVNVSDWATWQRIGGVALVVALSNVGLGKQLGIMQVHPKPIDRAKRINPLSLTPGGQPKFSADHIDALDFQRRIAELTMDELPFRVDDMPDEYFKLARELYTYCDDFEKVITGKAEIAILADRADWAAKLLLIQRSIEKDSSFGITRHALDVNAMATDLRYDMYATTGDQGNVTERRQGTGYRLREKGLLANHASSVAIQSAMQSAPNSTRARLRATILRNYPATQCNWHYATVLNPVTYEDRTIGFNDVQQTAFTDDDQAFLDHIDANNA